MPRTRVKNFVRVNLSLSKETVEKLRLKDNMSSFADAAISEKLALEKPETLEESIAWFKEFNQKSANICAESSLSLLRSDRYHDKNR